MTAVGGSNGIRFARACLAFFACAGSALAADAVLLRDAHVVESGTNAAKKYGLKDTLALREGRSIFLAFDLATLPADVTADRIARANLRLFATKVKAPGTFAVRALTAGFVESTISGANAPPFLSSAFDPVALPMAEIDQGRERVIDVTAFVKAWVGGGLANEGLTLIADGGSGLDVAFASREGDSGNKPRLEIEVDPAPSDETPPTHAVAQGQGFAPAVLPTTAVFAFVTGATTTITVAADEAIVVIASAALGTTNAAGSGDAAFDIGVRLSGSAAEPTVSANEFQLLRVGQNDRIPVTLTRVLSGLAPGNYEVGLVYRTNSAAWNNNDSARCLAFALRTP